MHRVVLFMCCVLWMILCKMMWSVFLIRIKKWWSSSDLPLVIFITIYTGLLDTHDLTRFDLIKLDSVWLILTWLSWSWHILLRLDLNRLNSTWLTLPASVWLSPMWLIQLCRLDCSWLESTWGVPIGCCWLIQSSGTVTKWTLRWVYFLLN